MLELGTLATRLAEATDVASAAEFLAEHLLRIAPGGGARIYLLGPGDHCATCAREQDCERRERCLHLEASLGAFAQPAGHVERIPQNDLVWRTALVGPGAAEPASDTAPTTPGAAVPPPPQLAGGDDPAAVSRLVPLTAGGRVLGVAGLRLVEPPSAEVESAFGTSALLAASTFLFLYGRRREEHRREQLLLVNDLGRKVTSILDDELMLRQAAEGIHRTFGFHNVMIFMRETSSAEGREPLLRLRAQASAGAPSSRLEATVRVGEGIVGRVCRNGRAEIISDVTVDPDFVEWYPDTRSEIALPILIDGQSEGVLNVESDQIDSFRDGEQLILETIATQLAIAIENARLFGMVKEREDRYRVLVESNPGAVVHLNTHGVMVFANPAAVELTGVPPEELTSAGRTLTSLAHEDSRNTVDTATMEAIQGRPRRDVEFEILHAEGGARFVQASFQPLQEEGQSPRGVVVLIRDQTREKELQQRLYQSEKLSAIGGLVSGVAHELNNPLAGILGFAQLMLGREPESWKRKDIERIETNAHRCQRIVENLLAFARQARLSRRLANVNEVIESVLRLNEYQFHVDDVVVEREFDSRIPPVYLDVNRWQQVFVNLATNAHQAIVAAESIERRIRFETRLEDGQVRVRVCDTGPGIPSEARGRVFEPFFTTKDSGTGLGLGICYGIVAEHGGRIELEPVDGTGACFRITLPLEARPQPTPGPDEASEPAQSKAGSGLRILVIDDEENVRDVVARALQNHCYAVDLASNGTTALERIEGATYDAILTDVSMPGPYRGIGLYDKIVEDRPELRDRIVFLSGYLHDDVLLSQIEARGGRFIEKPFNIHELARVVADVTGPCLEAEGSAENAEAPRADE